MNRRAGQGQAHALRLPFVIPQRVALQAPAPPQLFGSSPAREVPVRMCSLRLPRGQRCIQLQVLVLLVEQTLKGRTRRLHQHVEKFLNLTFTKTYIECAYASA
ncbi:hypothetical protein D3C72_1364880 [compost metagenome]